MLYMILKEKYRIPNHTDFYYHGLHLGQSRVSGRWEELLLNSPTKEADYEYYYKKYLDLTDSEIYRTLCEYAADFVQKEIDTMINTMREYYEE